MAVDSNDKIILAGSSNSALTGTKEDFVLARLNADGTNDITFGTPFGNARAGDNSLDFATEDDRVHALALPSGGGILLAGYATSGSTKEFALARYTDVGRV